jgi:hypothetical protein
MAKALDGVCPLSHHHQNQTPRQKCGGDLRAKWREGKMFSGALGRSGCFGLDPVRIRSNDIAGIGAIG